LFVCLIFTFEFSLVGAAEIEDPEYALVTTPLLGEFFSDESLADSSGANPELAREEVLQEKLNETISGRYPLAETLSLLTKVSDETAATAMEQLLAGLHGHERAQVVEALSRLGTPRCTALLIRTLRDADVDVVDAVLVSLVARGENTAVPQIVPLLSHSNPRLRRVAAEAIGVLAGEESASLLLPALMDQDLGVRVAVRSALTQIVGQDLGPSPVRWWQRLHAASR
jgi:HEAT repeat protein